MNLQGCHGNYNITGVWNSSNFMLFSGLGVYVYLVWTGLISVSVNDLKFMSFDYFKDYGYFCVQRLSVG